MCLISKSLCVLFRIQRAWRHYISNQPKSSNHHHHGDSFEEQVYQNKSTRPLTLTSNTMLTNTASNQPEATPANNSQHDRDSEIQACKPEAPVEGSQEGNLTVEIVQDINANSFTSVEDSNRRSHAEENVTEDTLVEEDMNKSSHTSVDCVEELPLEEDTTRNINVSIEKGDRKVRFNLETNDEVESSTVTQVDSLQVVAQSGLAAFARDITGHSNTVFDSSHEDTFTMPPEKVKQLGYTQLRELKCSLETKLGCKYNYQNYKNRSFLSIQ